MLHVVPEGFPVSPAPSSRRTRPELGEVLVRSLSVLLRGQLLTGEMATYFPQANGALLYVRSPVPSSYVHDALACFDPRSSFVETAVFDALPLARRARSLGAVVSLRRRIRDFLAWQENCDGSWRFFGRGSGVAPDADTTALAAAALLDRPRRTFKSPWLRHVQALGQLDPRHPDTDLATSANVLRLLALVGEAVDERLDAVLRRLEEPLESGARRYASPLADAYCAARAWAQAHLPRRDECRARLLPQLSLYQKPDGSFGGPLSTALGLSALVDLGHRGPEIGRAREALLDAIGAWGGWAFESVLPAAGGSLACSTAFAMSILARTSLRLT